MCCAKYFEKIREFDIFGLEMGMTYKGDKEFKTRMGGLITTVVVILLVVSGAIEIYGVLFNATYT